MRGIKVDVIFEQQTDAVTERALASLVPQAVSARKVRSSTSARLKVTVMDLPPSY